MVHEPDGGGEHLVAVRTLQRLVPCVEKVLINLSFMGGGVESIHPFKNYFHSKNYEFSGVF